MVAGHLRFVDLSVLSFVFFFISLLFPLGFDVLWPQQVWCIGLLLYNIKRRETLYHL